MTHAELETLILSGHAAAVGKSGGGKSVTLKGLVERSNPTSRWCIFDPIKSDYFGLTLAADGRHKGLDFVILGGPHGHAPLHPDAGAAIAEVVATGALPRVILDTSNFPMGGTNRFFIAFAETLLQRIRGVLHLVLEEAHEFAPKERSGIGAENMALHWSKKLATAGRTKGLRIIAASQRTQKIHNDLIGSADSVIAHRLLAPADQKPVLDYIAANVGKAEMQQVAATLSKLKNGEAWVCGPSIGVVRVQFPMIHTYDNTKTPDGSEELVKVPPVDVAALTSLIGEAVKEAEANDPAKLRARVKELEGKGGGAAAPAADVAAIEAKARDAGRLEISEAVREELSGLVTILDQVKVRIERAWHKMLTPPDGVSVQAQRAEVARVDWTTPPPHPRDSQPPEGFQLRNVVVEAKPIAPAAPSESTGDYGQDILNALAGLKAVGCVSPTRQTVGAMANKSPKSSQFDRVIAKLQQAGLVTYPATGELALTAAGVKKAGKPSKPLTLKDLHSAWLTCPALDDTQRRMLRLLISIHPRALSREDLCVQSGVSAKSSQSDRQIAGLANIGVVSYPTKGVVAVVPALVFPAGLK